MTWPVIVVKPDTDPEEALAERVAFVREAAGARAHDVELNLFVAIVAVTPDEPDLSLLRQLLPGFTTEQILRLPSVLVGSKQQIAEKAQHYRERYGINYLWIVEDSMDTFAKVIPHLR